MIGQEAFAGLIGRIVVAEFPEESMLYEVQGDRWTCDVCEGRTPKQPPPSAAHGFEFAHEVEVILHLLEIIKVTYDVIAIGKKAIPPSIATIRATWQKALSDAGLPSDKAVAISEKFSDEARHLMEIGDA